MGLCSENKNISRRTPHILIQGTKTVFNHSRRKKWIHFRHLIFAKIWLCLTHLANLYSVNNYFMNFIRENKTSCFWLFKIKNEDNTNANMQYWSIVFLETTDLCFGACCVCVCVCVWCCRNCIVWAKQSEQRRGKLAVTEKMRIWRQGDKEFKQNEACRLAALPSVTGVISWGSLSFCLLPLFISSEKSEKEGEEERQQHLYLTRHRPPCCTCQVTKLKHEWKEGSPNIYI